MPKHEAAQLPQLHAPAIPRNRRDWMLAMAGAAMLLHSALLAQPASQYPSKPVKILLSNAAGTAPDVAARILAQRYQELLGQPFVVDNRPGAGGMLAAEAMLAAPADGYTLMLGSMAELTLTPHIYKTVRYDVKRDFSAIAEVGSADLVLVVNPTLSPQKTLDEFLAWARPKQPLLVGTFGVGTPAHLTAMQFGDATQMKVEPVHYRAAGDGITGIASGDIHAIFVSVALSAPFIASGKLQALAVTSSARSPVLPDVPTVRELGLPDLEARFWLGMVGSAKVPADILDKLSDATVAALRTPDVRKRLEAAGFRVTGTSRSEFSQTVESDLNRWGVAIRRYGVRAD